MDNSRSYAIGIRGSGRRLEVETNNKLVIRSYFQKKNKKKMLNFLQAP